VAVLDLQRHAEPLPNQQRAIHPFGAHLHDHPPRVRPHHLGAGALLARDQLGVAEHGLDDARRRLGRGQSRVRQRHVPQRQREARHAAPIDRRADPLPGHSAPATHLFEAALLHRVREPEVVLRRPRVMARQGEHAGVLPGAVRIHSGEPHTACLVILGDVIGEWGVRPTAKVALATPHQLEEFAHPLDLRGLARVRGAAQRELGTGQVEPVRRPVHYQRQRLERLGRRAPERHEVGVAHPRDQRAVGVHHRDVHLVHRLDQPAAALFDAHAVFPGKAGQ
jgi:hypothetical protein